MEDLSRRERALRAILAALETVDGVELVERNRSVPMTEGVAPALLLIDGDIEGDLDEAGGTSRNPTDKILIDPSVFGFVEGSDATVGTKADALHWAAYRAIRSSEELRRIVGQSGRIKLADASFKQGKAKTGKAVVAFRLYLGITLSFDPLNP